MSSLRALPSPGSQIFSPILFFSLELFSIVFYIKVCDQF